MSERERGREDKREREKSEDLCWFNEVTPVDLLIFYLVIVYVVSVGVVSVDIHSDRELLVRKLSLWVYSVRIRIMWM